MRLISAILFLIVLSLPAVAKNDIRLRSQVIGDQLIPTIEINGKIVMKIQDRGARDKNESDFDRADQIYNTLLEAEEKGADLGDIHVVRTKDEYAGMIGRAVVFTVTEGDVIANGNVTPYRLASQWVDAIKTASKLDENGGASGTKRLAKNRIQDYTDVPDGHLFPFSFLLSGFSARGFVFFLFQLSLFSLFQVSIAYSVYTYFYKQVEEREHRFQARLDKLQYAVSTLRETLHTTTTSLETLQQARKDAEKSIELIKKL